MDSFNPFANAWGDEGSSDHPAAGPLDNNNITSFKFPNEQAPPTTHAADPLGFGNAAGTNGSTQSNVPDDDGWGDPIASTSTATFARDEWETAPSTPKPSEDTRSHSPEPSWHPPVDSVASSSTEHTWPDDDDNALAGEIDTTNKDSVAKNEEDDFGGFGEAGIEALPDLTHSTSPPQRPRRQHSDVDWGATELPPSKWDEEQNAPPSWGPTETSAGASDEQDDNVDASDPWAPPEARKASLSRTSADAGIDSRRASLERALQAEELDLEKLQSELGIQIRNLDEEYASRRTSSTEASGTSKTEAAAAAVSAATAKAGRWSLWGARKASAPTENGMDSIRTSAENQSPRASVSSAGAAPSPVMPRSPDNAAAKEVPASNADAQQPPVGVSRFFRFGKGRPATAEAAPTETTDKTAPVASASAAPPKPSAEIIDDFSQLENFDSRKASAAAQAGSKASGSAYADFGDSTSKDDDEPQKKPWFWNRGTTSPGSGRVGLRSRSHVVDYSAEQEEEQDLDKVFSAFDERKDSPAASNAAPQAGVARQPSLRSRGQAPGQNRAHDPFAHLSAAASSIRSSSSIDPFDPLDPLAELSNASNITGRNYKDQSQKALHRPRPVPFKAPPPLAPPPASGISRPSSRSSGATPSHLLPPPGPLSTVRKSSPQPSLLDDLADLDLSATSSPVSASSGLSPVSMQPPASAPRPTSTPAVPSNGANFVDDDFGDFETFSGPGVPDTQSKSPQSKPHKASAPMKLAAPGKKPDDAFFDLL